MRLLFGNDRKRLWKVRLLPDGSSSCAWGSVPGPFVMQHQMEASGGTVLVQGIIDVFWMENDKIILLDYKTDGPGKTGAGTFDALSDTASAVCRCIKPCIFYGYKKNGGGRKTHLFVSPEGGCHIMSRIVLASASPRRKRAARTDRTGI